MWTTGWRDTIWSQLDQKWDLIIIGGGITGAGILREASRTGLQTLLIEAHDFASGTSSRSTKMVHGGLRYPKNMQLKITLESVSERQRLLREGKGLVKRTGFLFASFKGDHTPGWVFGIGLAIYDLMARQWSHQSYNIEDMRDLCPPLTSPALQGGYRYIDAQTDDARLTLRVIREAVQDGGTALNYIKVESLLRTQDGQVCGVVLRDQAPQGQGRTAEVQAPLVISATGAWADVLRSQLGKSPRIRPLRGSHLVFPTSRLSLQRALSWMHPSGGRGIIGMPWEGVTLIGTTDIDHGPNLQTDVSISDQEAEYLLAAAQFAFPEQELSLVDVQCTFSGIRPVIDTGKADPSKESREHIIWQEDGLLTVSGGKLTTFRLMARDVLRTARRSLPERHIFDRELPVLDTISPQTEILLANKHLKTPDRLRLLGRYATDAPALVHAAQPGELESISETISLWAELRWAARSEGVVHLDDLLLRRVRLGLLLPDGGLNHMERIRSIVQPELEWDNDRWQHETEAYAKLWQQCYSLKNN
jgi:glycerol-3-phosphate dehydrogenase